EDNEEDRDGAQAAALALRPRHAVGERAVAALPPRRGELLGRSGRLELALLPTQDRHVGRTAVEEAVLLGGGGHRLVVERDFVVGVLRAGVATGLASERRDGAVDGAWRIARLMRFDLDLADGGHRLDVVLCVERDRIDLAGDEGATAGARIDDGRTP